jgi:hypothetical protein
MDRAARRRIAPDSVPYNPNLPLPYSRGGCRALREPSITKPNAKICVGSVADPSLWRCSHTIRSPTPALRRRGHELSFDPEHTGILPARAAPLDPSIDRMIGLAVDRTPTEQSNRDAPRFLTVPTPYFVQGQSVTTTRVFSAMLGIRMK